jgi:hypothetical protein
MRAPSGDRGQTMPIAALLLACCVVVAVAVVHLSIGATARVHAMNAADAAALAGAVGARDAAQAIATANDAELLTFTRAGDVVTVSVQRRGYRAVSSAEVVVELTGR